MEFYVLHWMVLLGIACFIMADMIHIYDQKAQFMVMLPKTVGGILKKESKID